MTDQNIPELHVRSSAVKMFQEKVLGGLRRELHMKGFFDVAPMRCAAIVATSSLHIPAALE